MDFCQIDRWIVNWFNLNTTCMDILLWGHRSVPYLPLFPELILGSVYSFVVELCNFWWSFLSSVIVSNSGLVGCDIALLGVSWRSEGTWCPRNVGKHPPTQRHISEDLIPLECTCLHHSYIVLCTVLYWMLPWSSPYSKYTNVVTSRI